MENQEKSFLDATDPFFLFKKWIDEAEQHEINDANAAALSTVGVDQMPSTRMVLIKKYGEDGFIFYTNKNSPKAKQIAENPNASLCLHWKSLKRQIRIEGAIIDVSDAQSDAYFQSRSRGSQLGSLTSKQSQILSSYDDFQLEYDQNAEKYKGQPIPRPAHWGGYCLLPKKIEFWMQQDYRCHTRKAFYLEQQSDGSWKWKSSLLYP